MSSSYRLVWIVNDVLSRGFIDVLCRVVLITMIAKSDDLSQVSIWRVIAVLAVFYKVFSQMLFRSFSVPGLRVFGGPEDSCSR